MNVLKFLRALRMLAFRHAPRTYHALNLSLVLFPLWYAVVCNMRLSTRIDKPDLINLICQSFCLPHPMDLDEQENNNSTSISNTASETKTIWVLFIAVPRTLCVD